jgi:hypothetical protein
MAKTKAQKNQALKHLAVLDADTRAEVLKQEGFSDAEAQEILDTLAEQDRLNALGPVSEMEPIEDVDVMEYAQESGVAEEAEVIIEQPQAPEPVKEAPKPAPAPAAKTAKKGHPIYAQIELYEADGKLQEGRTLKNVKIDHDRAERLNYQQKNTKIRYKLVQE